MTLTYRFVEGGGYDCMTDAFFIEDLMRSQHDERIATIDLRDFGQRNCEPCSVRQRDIAERIVKQLVDGFNKEGAT